MIKPNGTIEWYGGGNEVLFQTDLTGNNSTGTDYIFFAGQRLARVNLASGTVYHYFLNPLGSTRLVVAQNSNTPCYAADFYPYGGERVYSNGCPENFKFTGMERDGTGDDHTQFRQYMSNFGRWASPDPMGGDVTNPQSLNRYAYVMNNPTNFVDPLGLCKEGDDPCPPPDNGSTPIWDERDCGDLYVDHIYVGNTCVAPPGHKGGDHGGGGGALLQAMQNSAIALDDPQCAQAVDGGTGIAASTLASNFAAITGTSDPSEISSFGTIKSRSFYGQHNVGGVTINNNEITGVSLSGAPLFLGFTSSITMNSNPLGLFMNPWLVYTEATGTGTGYSNWIFRTIELLHELGHGSAFYGAPSAIVPDGGSASQSEQNTLAISNACFPQGDFGGNQGPSASPPTAVPAFARSTSFRGHF